MIPLSTPLFSHWSIPLTFFCVSVLRLFFGILQGTIWPDQSNFAETCVPGRCFVYFIQRCFICSPISITEFHRYGGWWHGTQDCGNLLHWQSDLVQYLLSLYYGWRCLILRFLRRRGAYISRKILKAGWVGLWNILFKAVQLHGGVIYSITG